MAQYLWGKVFYKDIYAGLLREEPGNCCSFTYETEYLKAKHPAIAHSLPLQAKTHIYKHGLHPFFDNLVAEGWLEHAQARLLGKRSFSRFELLLAFGFDCAGAVSVLDPEPHKLEGSMLNLEDPKELAILTNRASLSGVQAKLTLVKRDGTFFPSKVNELSSHIAKFPSASHDDLIINEYLSTIAFKTLLPDDNTVEMQIGEINGFSELALIIKRFDRDNGERIHFEEFNQLLEIPSKNKYDGSHKDMADFIKNTETCLAVEVYRLYSRILAGILIGNTDMHLKNFAMLHTNTGLRLSPSYDQVAANIYDYKTMALEIAGACNFPIGSLKAKHLIKLAEEFSLSKAAVEIIFNELQKNKNAAKEAIFKARIGSNKFKDSLIKLMEKRWNGTFALIGQSLSKKQ